MQDEDGVTPLLMSVKCDKAAAVRALIRNRCDVNTTDKDGKSTVYWAAQEGHLHVLKVRLCLHRCALLIK